MLHIHLYHATSGRLAIGRPSCNRSVFTHKNQLQWRVKRAQFASPNQQKTSISASTGNLATVAGLLLDIDGVLCYADKDGSKAVSGAAEVIRYMQAKALPYKFVTNTTTDARAGVAARLQGCGIPCSPDDIINPAVCATLYMQQHNLGPVALFVNPRLLPDFVGCQQLDPAAAAASGAAAVVLGDMGGLYTYEMMNRAFRLLMQQPRPELLSLGKARYFKAHDGLSLDVGPFTAALEFATGTPAIILGKPAPTVFQLAAKTLGLEPQQVVMVGDDVIGDVCGAKSAGCRGLLVRTGKYRAGDEGLGDVAPDGVLGSVADLPGWLNRAIGNDMPF